MCLSSNGPEFLEFTFKAEFNEGLLRGIKSIGIYGSHQRNNA